MDGKGKVHFSLACNKGNQNNDQQGGTFVYHQSHDFMGFYAGKIFIFLLQNNRLKRHEVGYMTHILFST